MLVFPYSPANGSYFRLTTCFSPARLVFPPHDLFLRRTACFSAARLVFAPHGLFLRQIT